MEPDAGDKSIRPDDAVVTARLLDLFIRAGLIGLLAALCYAVFAPFLTLVVWAVVLAVALSPLHVSVARLVRGRRWLASTLVVLTGILVLVVPTGLLMDSFGSTVKDLVDAVQNNTLQIPAPGE